MLYAYVATYTINGCNDGHHRAAVAAMVVVAWMTSMWDAEL